MTIVVTTVADGPIDLTDSEVSLREAIFLANESAAVLDVITFSADLDGSLIRLTEGEIEITDAVEIDGGGTITITGDADGDDIVDDAGITDVESSDLTDNSRIFNITASDADTILSGLILTGGYAASGNGGAVLSAANLTVEDSTVAGNSAASGGGGISAASATVTNSTISGNKAVSGGGIGAISAIITNSTITGNSAEVGGGIDIYGPNALTVRDSLVLGNYSQLQAGEISADSVAYQGGNIIGDEFSIDGVVQQNGLTAADVFAETVDVAGVLAGALDADGTIKLLNDAANLALDASSGPDIPSTDQIGNSYVDQPGVGAVGAANPGTRDLGAVELLQIVPDTEAPQIGDQSFSNAENQAVGAVLATVVATDNMGVTDFAITSATMMITSP